MIKRNWFTEMLKDDSVIDYRVNEPSLSALLNNMYKAIDKENKTKGVKDG